jgi:tellurite resistance protein TehA-like permease
MSDTFISLVMGAGTAAFAYSKFGRSVGYTNTKSIIVFVAAIFLFVFLFFLTLLKYVIHLH